MNKVMTAELIKNLQAEGYTVPYRYNNKVLMATTDSFTLAQDILSELCIDMDARVDYTADALTVYEDTHGVPLARYNFATGNLVISLTSNAHDLESYVLFGADNNPGYDVFDNPFQTLRLAASLLAH